MATRNLCCAYQMSIRPSWNRVAPSCCCALSFGQCDIKASMQVQLAALRPTPPSCYALH